MPDRRRLLELALKGLEADRAQLEAEIAEIRNQLGSSVVVARSGTSMTGSAKRKRRTVSAQAKKGRRSGGLTPAGRRKLSEMMKARWAAKRRAGKMAA
jgi:hypothetical protein